MSLALTSPAPAAPTISQADAEALANWRTNVSALRATQPALADRLDAVATHVTWTYGRDGWLTAQDPTGAWWAGCSVPDAAAKAMLRTMGTTGTVTCFLRPPTAAAVRVALEKLRGNQAVLAIV